MSEVKVETTKKREQTVYVVSFRKAVGKERNNSGYGFSYCLRQKFSQCISWKKHINNRYSTRQDAENQKNKQSKTKHFLKDF